MLSSQQISKWAAAAAAMCIVVAVAVVQLKKNNASRAASLPAEQQRGPSHSSSPPPEASIVRTTSTLSAAAGTSATGYVFPRDEVRPAPIVKLKHQESFERLTNAANTLVREIISNLEGKYGQVREWNKGYFLNITNQESNTVFLCTLYTHTGGLKQVDRIMPGKNSERTLITFYRNGGIEVFDHGPRTEGIAFYQDGKPEYFYSPLPDGREYSVDWDKAGQITSERIR